MPIENETEESNVPLSTDEAILDSIGEGNEPAANESTETQTVKETQNVAPIAATPGNSQDPNASTNPQPNQQQARGPQDLVDAKGQVIAAGGKERRFYEVAIKETNRANTLQKQLTEATSRNEGLEAAGGLGTQYGLSAEELTTGAQLMQAYKKDPTETIKYLLTQAQSNGHNVDGIISGSTDMQAVQQMLNSALSPLLADKQKETDEQENRDKAQQTYNEFHARHPDSAVHEDTLSQLLKQDPNLSVEAAYYKLQAFYSQKGLDWTKSLATLKAEQEANPQQASVNTQPQPPEGGGVSPNNVTDTAQVADVNVSTADIIRQAMADANIT